MPALSARSKTRVQELTLNRRGKSPVFAHRVDRTNHCEMAAVQSSRPKLIFGIPVLLRMQLPGFVTVKPG